MRALAQLSPSNVSLPRTILSSRGARWKRGKTPSRQKREETRGGKIVNQFPAEGQQNRERFSRIDRVSPIEQDVDRLSAIGFSDHRKYFRQSSVENVTEARDTALPFPITFSTSIVLCYMPDSLRTEVLSPEHRRPRRFRLFALRFAWPVD